MAKDNQKNVSIKGERKQITVVFCDLSGYTSLSEKLDPEEVQGIMERIFQGVAPIVEKYEGIIDKFIGDGVMIVFGVPKSHEDDAVRAIKAAGEIHALVNDIGLTFKEKIGRTLSMHTGINTGLVVTGEIESDRGRVNLSGDTVNVAARLTSLAKEGEIVAGQETCRQAERYFDFEPLEPTMVKGKAESVKAGKVISFKATPVALRRFTGLRSELIGRNTELVELKSSVELLRQGRRLLVSVRGEPGTGKSRLIEELKSTLNADEVGWLEGRSYAYSQNISYFPFVDFLNRAWRIEETDSKEALRQKIRSNIEALLGESDDSASIIEGLYVADDSPVRESSPEFWKARLFKVIGKIITSMVSKKPNVVFFEDIHWADPSSIELFRYIFSGSPKESPALFIYTCRPPFDLFNDAELTEIRIPRKAIELKGLSIEEAEGMTASLLMTDDIPRELREFIRDKIEGNPFYLEEVVNSLIDTGALVSENETWKVTKNLIDMDIPPTINGIVAARLDNIEQELKLILQKASVIGRTFIYDILEKITELKKSTATCLCRLESYDLIRTMAAQPDLIYIFKHVITQEVAYNGILRSERQEIHERVANVMEQHYEGRLSEFYETLAFHYSRGKSLYKAIDYLIKSGEKSLARYAVEEADLYYKEAFKLLDKKPNKTREDNLLLIDIILKWTLVFYCSGDFGQLEQMALEYKELAESLGDKSRLGFYYVWLGMALWAREKFADAHLYLGKAIKIGEEINDLQVIGYACAWLSRTTAEFGDIDKAISFGRRAGDIYEELITDKYLYFTAMAGLGWAYWFKGEKKKTYDTGKALLNYGQVHSTFRDEVFGHCVMGHSFFLDGDFSSAVDCYQKGISVSAETMHTWYTQFPKLFAGMCEISNGRFSEARVYLEDLIAFADKSGVEVVGTPARLFLGASLIASGDMARGLSMIQDINRSYRKRGYKYRYAISEYLLGEVFLKLSKRESKMSLAELLKNDGFILRNVPSAAKKAEEHFRSAIETATEIGARGILGQSLLGLGLLYKSKGKKDAAREYFLKAIELFSACEADTFLAKTNKSLSEL